MAAARTAGGSALDRLSFVAKLGLGLAMTALAAVFYFIIFYADVDKDIAAEQQRQGQLEGELASAKESRDAYQKDLDEKAKREQLASDQKKILPDNAETPAFLSAVQSVATVSGVNLLAYSPTNEVPAQFYVKVPMQLRLSGKYHQVAKFFHGVGQLDRIINMEDISMKLLSTPSNSKKPGGSEGATEVNIEVECLATAFRAKGAGDGSANSSQRRRRR